MSAYRQSDFSSLMSYQLLVIALLGACHREPRKSQPASVMQRLGETTITVRYNRPSARGRVLFGGIVPYGAVWDPGADEATTFATDHTIEFDGRLLRGGTYSVWVIPRPDTWTVILSNKSNTFHIPYPAGHDALRVDVVPLSGPFEETLAFDFPVADSDRAVMSMHWGTTVIVIPIAVRPSASGS